MDASTFMAWESSRYVLYVVTSREKIDVSLRRDVKAATKQKGI